MAREAFLLYWVRMVTIIDEEGGTVTVRDAPGERRYPMASNEAFVAASNAWVRCGSWPECAARLAASLTGPGTTRSALSQSSLRGGRILKWKNRHFHSTRAW
jgi:hypothetical protein